MFSSKALRAALLAGVFAFSAPAARADMLLTGAGKPPVAVSTYSGPGDTATYAHYWSVGPCYSGAYGLGNAFILKRASDSATQTIACLSTGLPNYAAAATFCNATTCKVRYLYDQATANTNPLDDSDAQTTPTYTASGLGTCAIMTSPSGTVYLTGTSFTVAQPFTMQAITSIIDNNNDSILGEYGGGVATVQIRAWFGPNGPLTLYAGSNVAGSALTSATYHDVMGYFNGASSTARVNATAETTVSPGATGLSAANKIRIMTVDSPGSIGLVQGGMMTGTQTSGARATLDTAIRALCGGF